MASRAIVLRPLVTRGLGWLSSPQTNFKPFILHNNILGGYLRSLESFYVMIERVAERKAPCET